MLELRKICVMSYKHRTNEGGTRQDVKAHISSLFLPDVRNEWTQTSSKLHNVTIRGENCLELYALVNNVPTNILLDSGSIVSCICNKSVQDNMKYFKSTQTLSVTNYSILQPLMVKKVYQTNVHDHWNIRYSVGDNWREYNDIFSECPSSIINVYEHEIRVTESEKFICKAYPILV